MGSALYCSGFDEDSYRPHFLDSCFLCHRPLAHNNDIFMYRGNTPFCSQECRQEQIEIDEANERRWKVSSNNNNSSKRSNTSRKNTNTTTDSRKESDRTEKSVVRTGVVAVA